MRRRQTHLDDDRLMGIALAGGREQDADALEHLTRCPECEARLRSLVHALDVDRLTAADEISAGFSAARLTAQRTRIMRRLDRLAGSARVLEFPDRALRPSPPRRAGLPGRWVAAAAMLGVVAGIGTGVLVDRRLAETPPAGARVVAPSVVPPDDDLLGDIDQLLESPAPELRAIDAFTPVSHEVVFTAR
jgi:hypothetical protein